MEATWYALIALMLTTYVVLDGFDFGAGIAQLFVARDEADRRLVLSAIGPFWDGNEVWLVASGGVLVFAFPRVYAVAFSGFYLPLMLVLWLLIGRGISIEFRAQIDHPLWRRFWDTAFALASLLLAFVLGASLGNVVRGVPLGAEGTFQVSLFELSLGPSGGALDGDTVLIGLFAVAVLALHGALYLAWKTDGPVHDRCLVLARKAWWVALGLGAVATVATWKIQPAIGERLARRPAAWVLALPLIGGVIASRRWARPDSELRAFLGSCAWIASLLALTAAALFPDLLRSTIDPRFSLDALNAASGHHGLAIGLAAWVPAIALGVGYFVFLFRSFRGKAQPGGYG